MAEQLFLNNINLKNNINSSVISSSSNINTSTTATATATAATTSETFFIDNNDILKVISCFSYPPATTNMDIKQKDNQKKESNSSNNSTDQRGIRRLQNYYDIRTAKNNSLPEAVVLQTSSTLDSDNYIYHPPPPAAPASSSSSSFINSLIRSSFQPQLHWAGTHLVTPNSTITSTAPFHKYPPPAISNTSNNITNTTTTTDPQISNGFTSSSSLSSNMMIMQTTTTTTTSKGGAGYNNTLYAHSAENIARLLQTGSGSRSGRIRHNNMNMNMPNNSPILPANQSNTFSCTTNNIYPPQDDQDQLLLSSSSWEELVAAAGDYIYNDHIDGAAAETSLWSLEKWLLDDH